MLFWWTNDNTSVSTFNQIAARFIFSHSAQHLGTSLNLFQLDVKWNEPKMDNNKLFFRKYNYHDEKKERMYLFLNVNLVDIFRFFFIFFSNIHNNAQINRFVSMYVLFVYLFPLVFHLYLIQMSKKYIFPVVENTSKMCSRFNCGICSYRIFVQIWSATRMKREYEKQRSLRSSRLDSAAVQIITISHYKENKNCCVDDYVSSERQISGREFDLRRILDDWIGSI